MTGANPDARGLRVRHRPLALLGGRGHWLGLWVCLFLS